MTPTTNTPVIGLVRVSTDEQEASGAGLDAQESLIRARCEQRGWNLTEIVRESASGKTLAKRPELQSILARLEDTSDAERPRALVVAKMDRLARRSIFATTRARGRSASDVSSRRARMLWSSGRFASVLPLADSRTISVRFQPRCSHRARMSDS